MFTFADATDLHRKFVDFYETGKVAAALCHGTAVLAYARLSEGRPLVEGRTVTGFPHVKEDAADRTTWNAGALPAVPSPSATATSSPASRTTPAPRPPA